MIELSSYEKQIIAQNLSPQLAELKAKYPCAVFNAADCQDLPPLPAYKPASFDMYFGDEDNPEELPNISFKDGQLDYLHLTEDCVNNPVIQIEIDANWAYIEIEKKILLDRLGNVVLPRIPDDISDEVMVKTFRLFQ